MFSLSHRRESTWRICPVSFGEKSICWARTCCLRGWRIRGDLHLSAAAADRIAATAEGIPPPPPG